jgi:hypothetical protein
MKHARIARPRRLRPHRATAETAFARLGQPDQPYNEWSRKGRVGCQRIGHGAQPSHREQSEPNSQPGKSA